MLHIQPTFSCSKTTIETLETGVKYVKINNNLKKINTKLNF